MMSSSRASSCRAEWAALCVSARRVEVFSTGGGGEGGNRGGAAAFWRGSGGFGAPTRQRHRGRSPVHVWFEALEQGKAARSATGQGAAPPANSSAATHANSCGVARSPWRPAGGRAAEGPVCSLSRRGAAPGSR